jgi:hypothetical protein
VCAVDLPRTPGAEERLNLVRTETRAGLERHGKD